MALVAIVCATAQAKPVAVFCAKGVGEGGAATLTAGAASEMLESGVLMRAASKTRSGSSDIFRDRSRESVVSPHVPS